MADRKSLVDALPADGAARRILIDAPPIAGGPGFDIKVDANVESEDELVIMLLLVVEKITGVRCENYVHLIDECRRIAARKQNQHSLDDEDGAR